MPKTKTPSFILELPLVVQPPAERVLLGRFEAGRRLYNAVLDEALKRLALMRESKAWQAARRRPQGKARGEAFGACKARFGFSEYALHAVATRHKNAAGFRDRLGAHETQKIGTRVWKAVSAYAFGVRGRPHFKGRDRPLHSLEGKNNLAGIRWNRDTGCVTWGKLTLPAMLPSKGQDPWLHAGLDAQTQYCRIVWRLVNARRRWFVQIVQRGVAPAKYDFLACGHVVGLDVGPSTVAIVGETGVAIESFAPGVVQSWRHQRRLQRALDRSRRATNPGNYHRNGVARKGCRSWVKSKRYLKLQRQTAEVERRLAATRKKEPCLSALLTSSRRDHYPLWRQPCPDTTSSVRLAALSSDSISMEGTWRTRQQDPRSGRSGPDRDPVLQGVSAQLRSERQGQGAWDVHRSAVPQGRACRRKARGLEHPAPGDESIRSHLGLAHEETAVAALAPPRRFRCDRAAGLL